MKEKYIPGEGCECSARCGCECGCDVDWTPREVYELREQRDRLAEALDRLERTAGLAALQDDPARVQARQALAAVKG
jgi:hypothetical protein